MARKKGRVRARRAGEARRSERRRRFADLAIGGMLLLAVYFAVFGGEYTAFAIADLEELEAARAAELARTEAQIDSLREVARALREDPVAIERVARERYGMIRDGEILYRFQESSEPTQVKPKRD